VIPADHKWFARTCVSAVLAHTLIDIAPRYPKVDAGKQKDLAETRALLEAEAPQGAAPDPFQAEIVTEAGQEEARKDSKQARKQRKRMKKAKAKLAKAKGSKA